jgi:hypothetical protein
MSGHDALVSQCKRCLDGTADVKDQMREVLDAAKICLKFPPQISQLLRSRDLRVLFSEPPRGGAIERLT